MTQKQRNALDLVLSFLNSIDVDCDRDDLRTTASYDAWLAAHGLPAAPRTRTRAIALRDALRGGAAGDGRRADVPAVNAVVRIGPDGAPSLSGTHGLSRIAVAAATLAIEGRWSRVKICPADDCVAAFYDQSRNHSRQWCDMAVCGARAKSRAFRARQSAS